MPFSVRASLDQFTLPHPGGEGDLRISVAAPANLTSATVSPVLYVVDGDLIYGMAAEIARAMTSADGMPALYVVGIGYDADYERLLKLRTADLSPPLAAEAGETLGTLGAMIGSERNGGADAFLAFLVETLRPQIATRHPATEGAEQFLFGHSLGGLFAAHALLTRPDAFSAYIASSPALWWDDFSIFRKLPAFGEAVARLAGPPRVMIDVGGREQDLPEELPPGTAMTLEDARAHIARARMVDAAREFAGALPAAGLATTRLIVFAEEDHLSVVPGALLHGMRFALRHRG